MAVTSRHNKYTSIPDWFSGQSTETATTSPISQTVYVGSSSGSTITGSTIDFNDIPIDKLTIVWLNEQLAVPIDNDKLIIVDGKVTTSANAGGVWELRQLTDGTNYIYTTYPVVTQLGITMYSGTEGLDIGGIYDGLPIDNNTIYWDIDSDGNRVLKAIGSSGGGVADSVAWANVVGKPMWLLDDKISYSEIEGTPDLSNYVVKSYVDDNFVTFTLDEVITGIKSFTNGLKIGESLIKQLQNDVVYIDANLVVRGGVTMYYDDGEIDIPNIKDQIGPAGYNEKGLASFDQTYFTINNGHVSLIEGAVGLNENELLNYLTNNQYAKKSDIPSLSGYATQSWVESKGFALNSDLTVLSTKVNDFLEGSDTDNIINKWKELEAFLTGLDGSNDLATILSWKADKTYVDETFVTIGGNTEQIITGPKNFVGGIKVNGSPIYYDKDKKYWKLEGDLLVTGGVTMYGNDSNFVASTIMDAILYDDSTLGINAQGQLYVKGSVGGATTLGGLSNVDSSVDDMLPGLLFNQNGTWISADNTTIRRYLGIVNTLGGLANVGSWADSVAPQDRIMYQAANSSQWVAKNLSDLAVGGVTGNYLPLSGGTLTGTLAVITEGVSLCLYRQQNNATPYIRFAKNATTQYGELGVYHDGRLVFWPSVSSQGGYGQWNTVWHAGNDGSGSGLDADLLDGYHVNGSQKPYGKIPLIAADGVMEVGKHIDFHNDNTTGSDFSTRLQCSGEHGNIVSLPSTGGTLALTTSHVSSATKATQDGDGKVIADTYFTDRGASNSFDDKIYNGAYRTSSFKPNDAYGYGLVASFRSMETCAQIYFPDGNREPQFRMQWNSQTSITNGWTALVTSSSIGNYNAGSATRIQAYQHNSDAKTIISGTRTDNTFPRSIYDNGWALCVKWQDGNGVVHNGTIATLNDNVASATKLATPRTIWGQSFDGTGSVDGDLTANGNITMRTGTAFDASKYLTLTNNASQYGRIGITFNGSTQDTNDIWGDGGRSRISFRRKYGTAAAYTDSYSIQHNLVNNTLGILYGSNVGIVLNGSGNVGIGTTNPLAKLQVEGLIKINAPLGGTGLEIVKDVNNTSSINLSSTSTDFWQISARYTSSENGNLKIYHYNGSTWANPLSINKSGNILVSGGITMYSDIRKKTKLKDVVLSLQQVANAPLIEHYYNSDQNKTTHVGSIAQYWYGLNDWFCKEDDEGYLTMEIQNCALASAISIARELDKYESKTDKKIRQLKKRISQLEDELETLKNK